MAKPLVPQVVGGGAGECLAAFVFRNDLKMMPMVELRCFQGLKFLGWNYVVKLEKVKAISFDECDFGSSVNEIGVVLFKVRNGTFVAKDADAHEIEGRTFEEGCVLEDDGVKRITV